MPVTAETLRELHRLRRHAKNLQDEIDRLPRLVKTQQAKITLQEKTQKQTQDQLTKLKLTAKDKEGKLKSAHEQIAKWEKQRNEVTNKKEYDALQIEITHAKESCQKLEDEILATLEEQEKLAARLPEIDKALQQAKKELSQSDQIQKEKQAVLTEELNKAQLQIKEIEPALPEDIRQQYERLITQRGEDALSAVNGRTCTACYTEITAQTYNNLLQSMFVQCKSCGRILYLPETVVSQK
jgi:predicted  nucleic acid-binding Zn-ribbon protein